MVWLRSLLYKLTSALFPKEGLVAGCTGAQGSRSKHCCSQGCCRGSRRHVTPACAPALLPITSLSFLPFPAMGSFPSSVFPPAPARLWVRSSSCASSAACSSVGLLRQGAAGLLGNNSNTVPDLHGAGPLFLIGTCVVGSWCATTPNFAGIWGGEAPGLRVWVSHTYLGSSSCSGGEGISTLTI